MNRTPMHSERLALANLPHRFVVFFCNPTTEMKTTDESETREEHGGKADVLVADGNYRPNKIEDGIDSQQGPEHEVCNLGNHNLGC